MGLRPCLRTSVKLGRRPYLLAGRVVLMIPALRLWTPGPELCGRLDLGLTANINLGIDKSSCAEIAGPIEMRYGKIRFHCR